MVKSFPYSISCFVLTKNIDQTMKLILMLLTIQYDLKSKIIYPLTNQRKYFDYKESHLVLKHENLF